MGLCCCIWEASSWSFWYIYTSGNVGPWGTALDQWRMEASGYIFSSSFSRQVIFKVRLSGVESGLFQWWLVLSYMLGLTFSPSLFNSSQPLHSHYLGSFLKINYLLQNCCKWHAPVLCFAFWENLGKRGMVASAVKTISLRSSGYQGQMDWLSLPSVAQTIACSLWCALISAGFCYLFFFFWNFLFILFYFKKYFYFFHYS